MGLKLNLVYNPLGAFLPPDQKLLEIEYKKFLKDKFNIDFDNLYTLNKYAYKKVSSLPEKKMMNINPI